MKVKAGKLWIAIFKAFDLIQPRIKPKPTVLVANALSFQTLNAELLSLSNLKIKT